MLTKVRQNTWHQEKPRLLSLLECGGQLTGGNYEPIAGAGLPPRLGLATWLCGPARKRDAGAQAVTVQPPRFLLEA